MSLEDKMQRWQSHVDREIEKALENVEDLPGAGKPLNLKSDENVPDQFRMAYKILAENDLAPDWILSGKDLEKAELNLRKQIQRSVRDYQERRFANADDVWTSEQRKLRSAAKKHNDNILTHNLKVPPGIAHRRSFNIDREIDKALRGSL